MTEVGKMRHRVELQQASESKDDHGDSAVAYTTVATVWAEVLEEGGTEQLQAGRQMTTKTGTAELRYYSGLAAKWRLKYGSRLLNIDAVTNPDGRQRKHLVRWTEKG